MIPPLVNELLESWLNWIYPPACAACGAEMESAAIPLCEPCLHFMTRLRPPVCALCGAPLEIDAAPPCPNCPDAKPAYACARSVLSYDDDRARNAIHALKFHYQKTLSLPLGRLLYIGWDYYYREVLFDALVPVPLHKQRRREREFNQSTLLCEVLSSFCRIPVREDLVFRIRKTIPQTKLDFKIRQKNLIGAIQPASGDAARNMSLLIVDDVMTTGATVNEVAAALKKGGAKKIAVLTLARAPRKAFST
ncbi:MAG: ComF family protein [Candidatus Omnitrophota bacterium]